MQRFFLSLALGSTITVDNPDFVHQISRVLRAKPEDQVILFNGDGEDWTYTIDTVTSRAIGLSPISSTKNHADLAHQIILWQALPNKHEKLEYLVQKGVECGIAEFHIWRAERSQDLFWNEKKLERLQTIAREALEQCGGNQPTKITFEKSLPASLKGAFFLHTLEKDSLSLAQARILSAKTNHTTLLVGPEGGFSPEETTLLKKSGALSVSLGSRILRTETAGPATAFAWLQG